MRVDLEMLLVRWMQRGNVNSALPFSLRRHFVWVLCNCLRLTVTHSFRRVTLWTAFSTHDSVTLWRLYHQNSQIRDSSYFEAYPQLIKVEQVNKICIWCSFQLHKENVIYSIDDNHNWWDLRTLKCFDESHTYIGARLYARYNVTLPLYNTV